MKVYPLFPKSFAANTYFVTEDGVRAVCIDPAQPCAAAEAERLGLDVKFVLLTHGHFDHTGGCAALEQKGAKIGCLNGEKELALHHDLGVEFTGNRTPSYQIGFTFGDGEELELAGIRLRVLATPGHTAGSACFLALPKNGEERRALFSGDTLFRGGIGRTDLPTGNARQIYESLAKLQALPFDCDLYPGHGESSTLMYEKKHNGYLKC